MKALREMIASIAILAAIFLTGGIVGYFLPHPGSVETITYTNEISRVITNDRIIYGTNEIILKPGQNTIIDDRGHYEVYSNAFSNFFHILSR